MALMVKDGKILMIGNDIATNENCCCCCLDASDDWSGTGGNSGAVGDSEYNCRWDDSNSDESWSIASSELSVSPDGPSSDNNIDNNLPNLAGDFSFSGSMDTSNFPNGGTGGNWAHQVTYVEFTSGYFFWSFFAIDNGSFGNAEKQGLQIGRAGQSDVHVDSTDFSEKAWTLIRSGSTITLNFGGVDYTYTNSNDLTRVLFQGINNGNLATYTANFGAVVLQDGSSNEIGLCD